MFVNIKSYRYKMVNIGIYYKLYNFTVLCSYNNSFSLALINKTIKCTVYFINLKYYNSNREKLNAFFMLNMKLLNVYTVMI